jgi:Malic enzyme, NAD binding domain
MQGTACSALAGIYGALRVQGLPPSALKDERIVVVGAGSAGMGVTAMIAKGMIKHGFSGEQARTRVYLPRCSPSACMLLCGALSWQWRESREGLAQNDYCAALRLARASRLAACLLARLPS